MHLKHAIITIAYFTMALVVLTAILVLDYHISQTKKLAALVKTYSYAAQDGNATFFGTLPKTAGAIIGAVIIHDARPAILRDFFIKYGSPLVNHADYMVEVADQYGLDYRLLPSIAMQESGGGNYIPSNSYNAWGYAITETQTLKFSGWEKAIGRVARGIKRDYIDQGLTTPEAIMTKYTPASLEKGGTWAKGVRFFMEQMP